ncbi:MAG: hypothetical protein J6B48_09335 [Clostridia bacterium]|nr:hypothetical protein [Clostridia bacterium]
MIQVKKTRKSKNLLAIIVTSSVLLLLIIGLFVAWFLVNQPVDDPVGPASPGKDFYPDVDSDDITGFEILYPEKETVGENPKQSFGAVLVGGTYYYFYYDQNGQRREYMPPINSEESGFDYKSLYALSDDGMNVPKITYILYALANTSYNSRIEIPDLTDEEKDSQLKVYGLDKASRKTCSFTYSKTVKNAEGKDEDKEFSATVYIGNKLVTGTGYYLMVDYPNTEEYNQQREEQGKYVYVSFGAENYTYALDGFAAFVSPTLVMGGNLDKNDKAAYSQLTPSYRQWKSVVCDGKGEKVKEKTKVVVKTDILSSAYTYYEDGKIKNMWVDENGYISSKNETTEIDLEYISSNDNKKLADVLIGKEIGDYSDNPITPIVVLDRNEADLGKTYVYKIHEIESVIASDGIERFSGAVAGNTLVKVRYSCTIDGKAVTYNVDNDVYTDKLHGIIDLTDERIPLDIRNKILTLSVGASFAPMEFDTVYTEGNSSSATFEFRIKRISHIISAETGAKSDTISDKTIVNFVYQVLHNGVETTEDSMSFDLTLETEKLDEMELAIRNALLGAKKEETGAYEKNITAYTAKTYYQLVKSFVSYSISEISYFVASEEIVSFKYANKSERDPFYGEAIHVNTLQNHKYSTYALDMSACDRVIKVLSGTLLGSSSTTFEGLSGDKVVAIGLTPENMERYGLYAYTVYYEIPRFVDSTTVDDSTEYSWWDSVGFTLYISKKDPITGKRYVGSDMYNLVVEMEGEIFDFVEEDFVDFWARRDMFMVDQADVKYFNAEFNLEGFKGKYSFQVDHPTMWIVNYMNGTTKLLPTEPADDAEGVKEKAPYEATYVYVDALDFDGATQTLLLERLKAEGPYKGKDGIHIHSIYNYLYENGLSSDKQTVNYDYLGDSCFKDMLYILYGTGYSGTLSEEEVADARSRGAVMSLSMVVEGSQVDNVYNFYYTSNGRVAVEIDDGVRQTCLFYITNHSFKMVVNAFVNLLNGKTLNFSGSYMNR